MSQEKPKSEPKIVNLFEDHGKTHEHDVDSYNKMKAEQDKQMSNEKA